MRGAGHYLSGRYEIDLEDGEVALYTGENGEITCKQVMKPDGTVSFNGKSLDVQVKKRKGEGGGVEITAEHCGGRMRIVAAITEPASVRRYLAGVGLPADPLALAPARPPPQAEFDYDC